MSIPTAALNNGQTTPEKENSYFCNAERDVATLCREEPDMVSPNSAMMSERDVEGKWFLMRAAYGQEKKAYEYLVDKEDIVEVFYPQWVQVRMIRGQKKNVMVSVLPNTLFVRSTAEVLRRYVGVPPMTYFHHYYQRNRDSRGNNIGNGRKPIVIPDNQVLSFRKWLDADTEDKIFINDTLVFKKDDLVRVTDGKFAGFIGHVVRLKGQTRVGINIEGVGFISTTYIPKHCLEVVES